MRKLLHLPRPESRPQRLPISQSQIEALRHRTWREATLPRITL